MSGPLKVHVEEITAALIGLRLAPTDVVVAKIPDADAEMCRIVARAIHRVVSDAGLPNPVVAVPSDWDMEAISMALLVGAKTG